MSDLPVPETPKKLPKSIANPLLAGLPQHLKDPKNFLPVQKALLETLTCGKSHSDPSQMFHCKKCTENMVKRRELMRRLGFKSPQQYMEWRRVHEEIKKRMPLDKYNKLISQTS